MHLKVFGIAAVVLLSGTAAPAMAQEPTPRATAYEEVTRWPDWSGVWSPGVSAASRTTPTPPKLTPEAQALVDEFEAGKARGENLQTQAANCIPNGMPGIMRLPYPIEFVYSPGRVNILIETYSEIRRIYVDGRPLPEDPDPFFNGHSVGHWEGDTLVIETVGFNDLFWFDFRGHPHSTQLKTIERYTRTKFGEMEVVTTIEDPGAYAKPFTVKYTHTLRPGWELMEYICNENNQDVEHIRGPAGL